MAKNKQTNKKQTKPKAYILHVFYFIFSSNSFLLYFIKVSLSLDKLGKKKLEKHGLCKHLLNTTPITIFLQHEDMWGSVGPHHRAKCYCECLKPSRIHQALLI